MTDYSNNNVEEIGNSSFTYFLRMAFRNFGIHIHNDFLICLANLPFCLNYDTENKPDYWLMEYIPMDILEFLSVTIGLTLTNNEFPLVHKYPQDIDYPILVFAKWKGFPTPAWGYVEKILTSDSFYGEVMNHEGLIKRTETQKILQIIIPDLSSFKISYEDIIKSIGKNALKYLGYSGPVFCDGYMYGAEFFQLWMEQIDERAIDIQPINTARFCSTISHNAKCASRYFLSAPIDSLNEMGTLFDNLAELLSPFNEPEDIKFILDTEEQVDFLIEAITRTKEIYLLIRPELEALAK
ncbi:hypothetical protein KAU33_09625 [Candidatus Dependentiae bacterium]|nr:hypothetical protein [Candidatus Dependentiae bacterium]